MGASAPDIYALDPLQILDLASRPARAFDLYEALGVPRSAIGLSLGVEEVVRDAALEFMSSFGLSVEDAGHMVDDHANAIPSKDRKTADIKKKILLDFTIVAATTGQPSARTAIAVALVHSRHYHGPRCDEETLEAILRGYREGLWQENTEEKRARGPQAVATFLATLGYN